MFTRKSWVFPFFVFILMSSWTISLSESLLTPLLLSSWWSIFISSSSCTELPPGSFLLSPVSSLLPLSFTFCRRFFSSHFFFKAWMMASIYLWGTVSSNLSYSAKLSASSWSSFSDSSSLASLESDELPYLFSSISRDLGIISSEMGCWLSSRGFRIWIVLSSLSKRSSNLFACEDSFGKDSQRSVESCWLVTVAVDGTNSAALTFSPVWEMLSSSSSCSIPNSFPSSLHRLMNSSHNPWQLPTVLKENGSPTTAMSDWARVRAVLSNFGSDRKYKYGFPISFPSFSLDALLGWEVRTVLTKRALNCLPVNQEARIRWYNDTKTNNSNNASSLFDKEC